MQTHKSPNGQLYRLVALHTEGLEAHNIVNLEYFEHNIIR